MRVCGSRDRRHYQLTVRSREKGAGCEWQCHPGGQWRLVGGPLSHSAVYLCARDRVAYHVTVGVHDAFHLHVRYTFVNKIVLTVAGASKQ